MLMIILFRWVPFMLFLQGLMFYTPHILYKWAEDKKVRQRFPGFFKQNITTGRGG